MRTKFPFSVDNKQLVKIAYLKLKQEVYYDQVDLFLRMRVAEFEAAEDFDARLNSVAVWLTKIEAHADPATVFGEIFAEKTIGYRLLPKGAELPKNKNTDSEEEESANYQPCGKIVSNVRSGDYYRVTGLNYFIDVPVEFHILSVIWCMIVGARLDSSLIVNCYGNRLDIVEGYDYRADTSSKLFKLFHRQYNEWRDKGVLRAQSLLDDKETALILSLDLTKCYYHLNVDWDELLKESEGSDLGSSLTLFLKQLHEKYRQAIDRDLRVTHDLDPSVEGLPIGLMSSRVLSNWLLGKFDKLVTDNLSPAYYGRYVDDMIIVLSGLTNADVRGGCVSIIQKCLMEKGILIKGDVHNNEPLELVEPKGVFLQPSKMALYYFDHNHSQAGLNEFLEKIRENCSEFKFLPRDDEGRDLDACAFDILFDGSVNKLRSIVGINENSTELSKYLARRLVENRLVESALNDKVAQQLKRFWKGTNLFDFCRLWEKTLTLFLIKHRHKEAKSYVRTVQATIDQLKDSGGETPPWVERMKNDLFVYLQISLALPLALFSDGEIAAYFGKNHDLLASIVAKLAETLRASNMFRHQFVCWPLLNYTSYKGNLAKFDFDKLVSTVDGWVNVCDSKSWIWSPRYIHPDEKVLLELLYALKEGRPVVIRENNEAYPEVKVSPAPMEALLEENQSGTSNKANLTQIEISTPEKGICVGVANMNVYEQDIRASYLMTKKPNLTFERQAKLYDLLNLAEKENVDLLVLPEVSVPYAWLPFVINHVRRSQTGLIFGLEHMVVKDKVYNLLVTALPYLANKKHKACFVSIRPKNHYAPAEAHDLRRCRLEPVSPVPAEYDLIRWRGHDFTVFNCFELTDIKHRGMFRSKIDFLVAVEWNTDVPYFSNLVESITRDLHCFMIQANASQHGDSRVTGPSGVEQRDLIRVSGGSNTTLVKIDLPVAQLREFQALEFTPEDKRYKPKPAGYDMESFEKRVAPK